MSKSTTSAKASNPNPTGKPKTSALAAGAGKPEKAAAPARPSGPQIKVVKVNKRKGISLKGKSATYKAGLEVRTAVLGREYVEQRFAEADSFNADLQDFVTEHAWGAVWARPGLPRKTRSLLVLAMTTALNRPHELEIHVRGALNNGVTPDEMKELFLQAAVYAGAPAALDGFRVARKVLKEQGKL